MSSLFFEWHFDPFVLVLILLIGMVHFVIRHPVKTNSVFFWTGLVLFILATSSPLHYLAMEYYFSAHMVCHIMILLLCGPLLVAGIPMTPHPVKTAAVSRISKFLYSYPLIAWLCGSFVMWVWHIPAVYERSHGSMVHSISIFPVLQSGSMLIAGMLFSWPIFSPVPKYRMHALTGVVYLFTACISCSLLGLLITFAPENTYGMVMENLARPTMMNNPLHITWAADHQAAGLIMWIPCCLVYLSGCFILISRWFTEKKGSVESSSQFLIN